MTVSRMMGLVAAALAAGGVSTAYAGLSNVPIFSVNAYSGQSLVDSFATSVTGTSAVFNTNGQYAWQPGWSSQNSAGSGAFTLWNDNWAAGRRTGASFVADPVTTNFFAIQNNTASTLEFEIVVPVLSFPKDVYFLTNASAQIGVTDTNGDGAAIVGSYAGGTVAQWTLSDGASPVLSGALTTGFSAGAFGSNSNSENFTSGSTSYLIDSQVIIFKFTLTPGDIATGSGVVTTTLVPAPGSIALMGLGGLVAIRRRR